MELQPHAEVVIDFGGGPTRVHFQMGVATGTATPDIELSRVESFGENVLAGLTTDELDTIKQSVMERINADKT